MTINTTWLDQLFLFPGGLITIAMTDANRVELADNLVNTFNLKYTGTLTADRTIQFPLPSEDARAYNRTVYNATTGGFDLIISVGIGATISVGPGQTFQLIFQPDRVRQVNS